jgi:hypothetical protein
LVVLGAEEMGAIFPETETDKMDKPTPAAAAADLAMDLLAGTEGLESWLFAINNSQYLDVKIAAQPL